MQKRANLSLILLLIALILLAALYFISYKAEITGFASQSQIGNMTAVITTYVACTWSDEAMNVSFGTNLNPGINDYNGTKNYFEQYSGTSYNVTVDPLSNKVVNMTIKGDHFRSGANSIYVGNTTWFSNTTYANGTNMIPTNSKVMLTTYDKNTSNYIGVNEPIGSSVWYRFWLDIPAAQISGTYVGNYTMQCEEAN